MSEVNAWDVVAANNNTAPPDGWPEGMNYSEVNDAARELQAAVKRWFADVGGNLAAAGSVNVYTVTLHAPYAAYFTGLTFRCTIPAANTGAATINANGLGNRSIVSRTGAALTANALRMGRAYTFRYNGTDFEVLDSSTLPNAFVTNAALVDMAQATVKGRASGAGTGVPVNLSASQLATIVQGADVFLEQSEGSFTAALTGMVTTTEGTVSWVRVGRRVTLVIQGASLLGTSNANTMTMTGLPAILWPASFRTVLVSGASDSGSEVLATAQINTDGSVDFWKLTTGAIFSPTGWAASGGKGLAAGEFSYIV